MEIMGILGPIISALLAPSPPSLPTPPPVVPPPQPPVAAVTEQNLNAQQTLSQSADQSRNMSRMFAGFNSPATLLNQVGQDPNVQGKSLLGQ